MTTAALLGHVAAYAARVRTHLADLSPEQVDDLTDGLEADLAEALADPDGRPATGEIPTVAPGSATDQDATILDLVARFGPPDAYAEELRSAAGMPSAPVDSDPQPGPTRGQVLLAWWQEKRAAVTAHPRWPAVSSFLLAVRPAWWVARGWVLFGIAFTVNSSTGTVVAPAAAGEWIVFLLLVWLSVEYGRGRWVLPRPLRGIAVGLSVLAALCVLPGIASASTAGTREEVWVPYTEPVADGVYIDGRAVTNLFVYDADGNYVEAAQVLDNRGRAVTVSRPEGVYLQSEATTLFWVPRLDVDGRAVLNAYPVPTLRDADAWSVDDLDDARGRATVPPPPVLRIAPLAPLADPTADGAGAPGATGAPTQPGDEDSVDPDAEAPSAPGGDASGAPDDASGAPAGATVSPEAADGSAPPGGDDAAPGEGGGSGAAKASGARDRAATTPAR